MKALLLAAGIGSRLSPYTEILPKCLMPIKGKPLLGYWLSALKEANIVSTLINLHHHSELVTKYLSKINTNIPIKTVYEPELLNTGGTLLANRDFFKDSPIMLIHADNFCLANLSEFIKAYNERSAETVMTMMTFHTSSPESCGIVELDKSGLVKAFHEKKKNPPGNLANAGVYILEDSIFDYLEKLDKEKVDFSLDVIPNLIGQINTFHNDVYHQDIGTIENLKLAQKHEFLNSAKSYFQVDSSLPLKSQIELLAKTLKKN